jgi:hypothetical protein
MRHRNIRKNRVAAAMGCSDRQLYNYMARLIPIPGLQLGQLCKVMQMPPQQLVDERYYLLPG